jgi:hypothetical protein
MGHYRQTAGGDSELVQRYAELSALHTRNAEARAELHQLREEIIQLGTFYDQTLGRRLAELNAVEAEILRYTGNSHNDSSNTPSAGSAEQEPARQSEEPDIKSLYREVAKSIHPDVVGPGPVTLKCNELMSKANRAYAEQDRGTLKEILRNWWQNRAEWDQEWAELVRVKTRIAAERKDFEAISAQVQEKRNSFAYRLKATLDAGCFGSRVLADMVTAVDLRIDRAARDLAALKAHAEQFSARDTQGARTVEFPSQQCCGTVYLRDRHSVDFSKWQKYGLARGRICIATDKAVRLDVRGEGKLEFLSRLRRDDLQSLYLLEGCDPDLEEVRHLADLEELYLSGSGVTDSALMTVSALRNLKRIYIYQTSVSDEGLMHLQRLPSLRGLTSSGNRITDAGLAGFERALPGVKTVSFQWRR